MENDSREEERNFRGLLLL